VIDKAWRGYAQLYIKLNFSKLADGLTTVLPESQSRIEALQAELDKVYPNCRSMHPFYEEKLAFLEHCRESPPEPVLGKYLINILVAAGETNTLFVSGLTGLPEESTVIEEAAVPPRPPSAPGGAGKTAKPKAVAAKGAKASDSVAEGSDVYVPPNLRQTYSQRLVVSELASSASQYSRFFATLERLGIVVPHGVTFVAETEEERSVLLKGSFRPSDVGGVPGRAAAASPEHEVLCCTELETPHYVIEPQARALGELAARQTLAMAKKDQPNDTSADTRSRSPRLGSFESSASGAGRRLTSRSRYSRTSGDSRVPPEPRPSPPPSLILGLNLECVTRQAEEQSVADSKPPRSASKGARSSIDTSQPMTARKQGKKPEAEAEAGRPCFDPADTPDSFLTRPQLALLHGYWGFKASCVAELESYVQDVLELSTEGRCALPQ